MHIHGGRHSKCTNLIFVALWREKKDGTLLVKKLHHLCSDPNQNQADQYFVADAWDYHLRDRESGFFSKFKKIYISGDHGPHFSGAETIVNYSRFFSKYVLFISPFPPISPVFWWYIILQIR